MHGPRTCKYCEKSTMEFIIYEGLAFCDTDCLVDWVRDELRPTTGAVDLLHACACGRIIPADKYRCLTCQRELANH